MILFHLAAVAITMSTTIQASLLRFAQRTRNYRG